MSVLIFIGILDIMAVVTLIITCQNLFWSTSLSIDMVLYCALGYMGYEAGEK